MHSQEILSVKIYLNPYAFCQILTCMYAKYENFRILVLTTSDILIHFCRMVFFEGNMVRYIRSMERGVMLQRCHFFWLLCRNI